MPIEQYLAAITAQERALTFARFGAVESWAVGTALRDEALRRRAAMSFEITLAGRLLFACATDNAPAGQADWLRRKRNTVLRFGRCSYAIGLELELQGRSLTDRALDWKDYAVHGGGFPILLAGTGCVGSVVASGLDQREDHAMVVAALAAALGITVDPLP